jgi:tetratricopeptide (TPR) repeat protein
MTSSQPYQPTNRNGRRVDSNPPGSGHYLARARECLADGKLEVALATLDLASLAEPGNAAVRVLRGRVLLRLQRYASAVTELDAAVVIDAANPEEWLTRGLANIGLGEWEAAAADCSRCIELGGDSAELRLTLGRARYKLGLFAAAEADLSVAVAQSPVDPAGYYWLGLARRDGGKPEQSVSAFTVAIELDPRHTEAYVSRGKAYAAMGDLAAARIDWAVAGQLLHQSH